MKTIKTYLKSTLAILLLVIVITLFLNATLEKRELTNKMSDKGCNCKGTEVKIDEFTKSKKVTTELYDFYEEDINLTRSTLKDFSYNGNAGAKSTTLYFKIMAYEENGVRMLYFTKWVYQVSRYLRFPYSKEDAQLMFLLTNDEVVNLIPSQIDNPELLEGFETHSLWFTINDVDWLKLKSSSVKKIRITYLDNNNAYNKDFSIEKKYANNIACAFDCIDNVSPKTNFNQK